jgi:hypothetical protein
MPNNVDDAMSNNSENVTDVTLGIILRHPSLNIFRSRVDRRKEIGVTFPT